MSKVLLRIKGFGCSQRNNFILKSCAGIIIVVLITLGIVSVTYSDNVSSELAGNLVRLHVIANSDSQQDQALKRDIRDIIISYMKEQLKVSKDLGQTKDIINSNLNKIRDIAADEVKRQEKNYDVKVMLGEYPFPTKSYGDITLPAGYYQALRVVIGKGEGANWWCVLFPPLCFVDATHGTVPDSVKEDLKQALTDEEYRIITSAESDNDIPIKVKFRVVELFQNSKIKFAGIINKLFK